MKTNVMMNENEIRDKYLRGNKAKLNIAKIATVCLMIAAVLLSVYTGGSSETNLKNRVYDNDKILSDATINAINGKNDSLSRATGAEIVVVVEKDSSKNKDLPKRAEKLFKDYKVSDNGLLFIVAVPKETQKALNTANSSTETAESTTSDSKINRIINDIADAVESAGEAISGIFSENKYAYAYSIGRNVDYSLDEKLDGIFADNFDSYYNSGNYNAAVLNTFNAFYDYFNNYYGAGLSGSTAYGDTPEIPERPERPLVPDYPDYNNSYANNANNYEINTGVGMVRIFAIMQVAGIFLFVMFLIFVFSRRRGPTVRRVYRSPFWFGLGLGSLGGLMRRPRHHHHPRNTFWGGGSHTFHTNHTRRNNNNSSWGSFFGSGGNSGSGGSRSGGGFKGGSGGFGNSSRSGGGFRSGGSSRGGGGGFRSGGGSSRGGGGGRRR